MKRNINLLITGVGGPTPRSFARALKEWGTYANYRLVATDIHAYAIGLYQKELFDKSYITPKSNQPGYWSSIEEIIDREKIDMAVILPESEVITWSHRQLEGQLPCPALIPDKRAIDTMFDKGVLSQYLEPLGLVPKTVVIDKSDPKLQEYIEAKLSYPYWIRSATGSSGLGSYKIHQHSDLLKWVSINEDISTFIASEFLSGRNLACKLLYYEGQLLRSACGERVNYIMSKIAPSGITGNTSFGRLINDEKVFQRSKSAIEYLFEVSGAVPHGFFTVDLKEDQNGVAMVTEINFRHVAFTQCFAMSGANLCEDSIRILDKDPLFNHDFLLYKFEEGLAFLRDVDERPIIINENELMQ